ncbi:MAG: hypothetical protein IPL32_15845 [Chloracidobacterium sp.]|nr:hypothetical protein [Chloracidobacterium sp.]
MNNRIGDGNSAKKYFFLRTRWLMLTVFAAIIALGISSLALYTKAAAQPVKGTETAAPLAGDYVFRQRIANPGGTSDYFCFDVSGNTAILGSQNIGGSFDVVVWNGDEWSIQQTLVPFPGSESGYIVAKISGNRIAISKVGDSFAGLVIYLRTGSTWSIEDTIPANESPFLLDMSDSVILISKPGALINNERYTGAVDVYRRNGSEWGLTQTLTGLSPTTEYGFGYQTSISGNTAMIVARPWPPNLDYSVYFFVDNGSSFVLQERMFPLNNGFNEVSFIDLDGDTAVLSCSSPQCNVQPPGVYQRTGNDWTFFQSLVTGGGVLMKLAGDKIGIPQVNGTTHIHTRGPTNWTPTQVIPAPPNSPGAATQIFMDGRWLLNNNPEPTGPNERGAIYFYDLGASGEVKMRRPSTASLTQASIDQGLVNIDAPLEFNTSRVELELAPIVEKGLVADGVTPLLFDLEIPEEDIAGTSVAAEVEIEVMGGGTIDGDVLEDRMRYLGLNGWDTVPQFTFTKSENKHFAYLGPIGSDELQFDSGENEIEVKLSLRSQGTSEELGSKTFYIRKPPIALVHGYNTDGTWGDAFAGVLATSRPRFEDGEEDFIRTIRYGQEPASAGDTEKQNTVLTFGQLVPMLEGEIAEMRQSIRSEWAMTRHDVVAHSQGGILSRLLCSQNSSQFLPQPFRNPDNFNRGRFHRVVTIGSPHNGTRLVRYMEALKARFGGSPSRFSLRSYHSF